VIASATCSEELRRDAMDKNRWLIKVANPSPYERSDYVEVDLESLGVDSSQDEKSLKLSRVEGDNAPKEIPYQIDYPLGRELSKRILTFRPGNVPGTELGRDDYSVESARFVLEQGTPKMFKAQNLWVDYYYAPPDQKRGDAPSDGFNQEWDGTRSPYGVKLRSDRLEIYFGLESDPRADAAPDHNGSITSVFLREAPRTEDVADNMLCPSGFGTWPEKRWGQLTDLAFFPPPWELACLRKTPLQGKNYELVWSNCGNLRAMLGLRSKPFLIQYGGDPLLKSGSQDIPCRLHRVLYICPGEPLYTEELFVVAENGQLISFRPHYCSNIHYPESVAPDFRRFEHIPDYFAIWRHFGEHHGYGFAANAPARSIRISGDELRWRLTTAFHHRCIHCFMYHGFGDDQFDPFHEVGHLWYLRAFKPLKAVPVPTFALARTYSPLPSPVKGREGGLPRVKKDLLIEMVKDGTPRLVK
jgi:hypothetical protein